MPIVKSKVKRSRALGIALTDKAARYMEHRSYGPGDHGRARRRPDSDYKLRLREKQRLRAQYNVSEAQLRRALDRASRSPGKTGDALLTDLETRLDAVVLRAGFARTIYQARQAVSHGHVRVDGQKVDKPSYRLRPGQAVEIAGRSKTLPPFLAAASGDYAAGVPAYLTVDAADLRARLERLPARDEIPVSCDERLVVEYYSR
jgi:small subunit ribosomal protein S4